LTFFENLALEGYDHIIDIADDEGNSLIDIATNRGYDELADYLKNLRPMEVSSLPKSFLNFIFICQSFAGNS